MTSDSEVADHILPTWFYEETCLVDISMEPIFLSFEKGPKTIRTNADILTDDPDNFVWRYPNADKMIMFFRRKYESHCIFYAN